MALYVKDEEVDRLAREVQAAYGVKTKTEAVRIALQRALDQTEAKPSDQNPTTASCLLARGTSSSFTTVK